MHRLATGGRQADQCSRILVRSAPRLSVPVPSDAIGGDKGRHTSIAEQPNELGRTTIGAAIVLDQPQVGARIGPQPR